MGGIALSARSTATGPAWLWPAVFAVGLAAVLVGFTPPGQLDEIGRAAATRLLQGNFDVSVVELGAIVVVGGWMALKPLAIIGVLLWLESRFSPPLGRQNLTLSWIAQSLAVSIMVVVNVVIDLVTVFPAPLIKIGAADSILSWLVLVPAFVVGLTVASFFQYWSHRAFHRFPFMWRWHSLHHSMEVDVLHNIIHPLEATIAIFIVGLPTILLIDVSTDQLLLIVAFAQIQGHLSHSRLPIHFGPLRYVLCDNRYHVIHHSLDPAHYDKNFANSPLWDMLFGTYHPAVPAGGHLLPTGLDDRFPPRTLAQYLTVRLPPRNAAPDGAP